MCASRTTQAAWDSRQNFIRIFLFFSFFKKGHSSGARSHTPALFFSLLLKKKAINSIPILPYVIHVKAVFWVE